MLSRKKRSRLVMSAVLILSLAIMLILNGILPLLAAVSWTKYGGGVTLGSSEQYVVDSWVIKDGTTYKMWYTHGKTDLSVNEIVNTVSSLGLDDIITDIANLNLDQLLNDLINLDLNKLISLLDGTSTVIGYATSSDGTTWTVENNEVFAGSGGIWNSVGAPCIINDDGTYKMWYTRVKTNLTQASLQTIINNMAVPAQRKNAIVDLLNSTSTVIGYATSLDGGASWTPQNNEVFAGSGSAWSSMNSVGDPCIIKDDTTYKMWYTRAVTDLLDADLDTILAGMSSFEVDDLLGILDGTGTVIGYATSPDGISWTPQGNNVLPGTDGSLWESMANPSVIKVGNTYEAWFTNVRTDLVMASFRSLMHEIAGKSSSVWGVIQAFVSGDLQQLLNDLNALDITTLKSLLGGTSTVIGYATSTDGTNWTVLNPQHLVGVSSSLWSSVATPTVSKSGTKYEMWYTEGIDDLTVQELLDLGLGTDLPVGYASYTPGGGGGGGGGLGGPITAEDIMKLPTDEAADILEQLRPEDAADIMEELPADMAADIMEEMDTVKAALMADEMDAGKLADIVEEMDTCKPADIMAEMLVVKASTVMEELTTEKLTDVVECMSEQALMERLPLLSPDKLHSIEVRVLLGALPSAPVEHLIGETPPTAPAEATAPVVVFVTPNRARYMAIQTWAGEWVVVMGTPIPVSELMIKTNQALSRVETILEVFDEMPSEVKVGLPDEQIVYTYLDIGFEKASPDDIELGYMAFEIEKSWLEQNSIHRWSVILSGYNPELRQWVDMPTRRVDEDDSRVYYTAVITHFSTFAISGSQILLSPNFVVDNLVISPAEADIGETVIISADVTNLSDTAETYAATLWLDDAVEAGQDINVLAGDTESISFTAARDVEGVYQFRLGPLFGSFSVTEKTSLPAAFSVSELVITPTGVDLGDTVTIRVLLANTGGLTGEYEVTLKIDGVAVTSERVTLAAGASRIVSFVTTQDVVGTYAVDVEGLTGTFAVSIPPTPPSTVNWWLISGIFVAYVILVAIALVVLRRLRARREVT